MFIGKTDVETETPIFWPPDAKSWLIGKDPDAGKYWGQEEKGTTEEEMVWWHHQLNGHGFGWTPRVGDGQRGLLCCGSWCRKESDTTDKLKWLPLSLSVKISPVFPFVSASLNLSASVIYYDLEGVILWGSITVECVPQSAGGWGWIWCTMDHKSHLSLGCASTYSGEVQWYQVWSQMWGRDFLFLSGFHCPIGGRVGSQGPGAEELNVRPDLAVFPQVWTLPSHSTATLGTEGQEEDVLVRKITKRANLQDGCLQRYRLLPTCHLCHHHQ